MNLDDGVVEDVPSVFCNRVIFLFMEEKERMKKMIEQEIGALLYRNYEKFRDEKGWTNYKVIREAGIPQQSTLTAWKNNDQIPRTINLLKICHVLGITLNDITQGVSEILDRMGPQDQDTGSGAMEG